jgi:hypothetical protein
MRHLALRSTFACLSLLFAACRDDDAVPGADGESSPTTGEPGDGDPGDGDSGDGDSGDGDGEPDEIAGLELMTALAGLWSGPATMTPLGSFEPMNMDLRAADGHVLFSRADLDPVNSLRFAFSIETIAGVDRLVYRNGGYFYGMLRDSRTILVEQGPNTWRFCAVDGGCDYIDARWELQSPTELVFDVEVKGAQHVLWLADRVETRTLPDPFPADHGPQGSGDAPFPTMPSLRVTVSWQDPLSDPADVWVLLSVPDCPLMGFCEFSRSLYATAEVGATSSELLIDQVHAGNYKGNAVLDRDRNLTESLFPGSGDAVSLPNQPITIAATGESTATLVTLVEL